VIAVGIVLAGGLTLLTARYGSLIIRSLVLN